MSLIPKNTWKSQLYQNKVSAVQFFKARSTPTHFSAALDTYMAMDWSLLSRDKRIPLNSQVTSRITRVNPSISALDSLGIAERLLTNEQKKKLGHRQSQSSPLTYFMRQLQTQSSSPIVHSCQRRFGSCARDMIDMRHKWFIKSVSRLFLSRLHLSYLFFSRSSLFNNTNSWTKNTMSPVNKRSILC